MSNETHALTLGDLDRFEGMTIHCLLCGRIVQYQPGHIFRAHSRLTPSTRIVRELGAVQDRDL
jgi:hypothetical protein